MWLLFKTHWRKLTMAGKLCCALLLFSVIILVVLLYRFANNRISSCCVGELPINNKEGITALRFLPHSRILLFGSMLGRVDVWDIENGLQSHLFKSYSPMCISTHPNGDIFATEWRADRVACRSYSSPAELHIYPDSPGTINVLSFSPTGKLLAAGGLDAIVKVWEVSSRRLTSTLRGHAHSVTALDFYDDHLLATAGASLDHICIWELPSNNKLIELDCPLSAVNALFFVNRSTIVTMGHRLPRSETDKSLSGEIRFWDLSDANCKMTITVANPISSAVLAPDKVRFFAGCTDGTLLIGNIREAQITRRIRAHRRNISTLTISSDGQLLASSTDDGGSWGVIRLWDVSCLCR